MTAMLNIKDLRAYYGQVQALHGLSFSLNEGSLTTLLGANGAGKTTTLRALCGMVRTEGEISFGGQRIDGRATEDIVRGCRSISSICWRTVVMLPYCNWPARLPRSGRRIGPIFRV